MAVLGRFVKQPGERADYDVDYTEWFAPREDTPASHTATVESGLTLVSTARNGKIVKVTVSGGTNRRNYKVTVRLTTSTGIIREADFIVAIRES